MATPQITLRVSPSTLLMWKSACEANGTTVSSQIRRLMNKWVAEAKADLPKA